jgi:hypothetical protein
MQPHDLRPTLLGAGYLYESSKGSQWTIKVWNTASVKLGDTAVYMWQCDPPEGTVILATAKYDNPERALHDAVQAIWTRELQPQ